jgi:oxalate decarboxylase/phosphoglucose isomerase-like protein (cupin superfamily)
MNSGNMNFKKLKLNIGIEFSFCLKQSRGEILLVSKKDIPHYKRYASKLIKDEVILDLENAKRKIERTGDFIVYEVYNLWKSEEFFQKLHRRIGLVGDLTILKHGVFSDSGKGELFSTYGHAHEKDFGEVYMILKNECFLTLTEKGSLKTFIVKLKEGTSAFIHPKFMHRTTAYRKDCLFLTLAPEKAGHDYLCVKGKGFPIHLFYDADGGKVEFRENPRFKVDYTIVKKLDKKVDAFKIAQENPEMLKEILENPERYRDFYFVQ